MHDRNYPDVEQWEDKNKHITNKIENFKKLIKEALTPDYLKEGFYSTPQDMEDSGLNIIPRDQLHANKLKDVLKNTDLYYEWDVREGYFFFPEEEDGYDQLEIEIQNLMDENNIQGYIEGVF